MRIFLIGFILSSFLLSIDLKWEQDLDKAFVKAQDTNKTVMIFVTKSGCRWCVKMKKRTLSHKVIKQDLENYILVKLDRNNIYNYDFIDNIKYFPTILFYSPKKRLYEKVVGYFNVEDFMSWIDDVENKVKNSDSI